MLISFAPDGRIEFTRTPVMLSLFEGERMRLERMTDILFNEDYQRYYVWFKTGPLKDSALGILTEGWADFQMEYGGFDTLFQIHTEAHGLVTFDTYEDAVKAEIRFVEYLRDLGHSMTA